MKEEFEYLKRQIADEDKSVASQDETLASTRAGEKHMRKLSAQTADPQKKGDSAKDILDERREQVRSLLSRLDSNQEEFEKLAAQLTEQRESVRALFAQRADRRMMLESPSTQASDEEKLIAEMERQIAEKERTERSLKIRLAEKQEKIKEKDQAVNYLTARIADLESILAARDEAISWLLKEVAQREQVTKVVSEQLRARQNQLERINASIGWRLLSKYGRIKYRYLLPVYRMLGLMPAEPAEKKTQLDSPQASETQPTAKLQSFEQTQQAPLTVSLPANSVDGTKRDGFYGALTILPHLREEELTIIADSSPPAKPLYRADVICFSIIDWEFRYQRPQQIMSQFAAHGHRVFYISAARFRPPDSSPRAHVHRIKENVYEVQLAALWQPDVYGEVFEGENKAALLESLDELRRVYRIEEAIGYVMISSWASVALEAKRRWGWRAIYDCMDEWENFPGISRALLDMELRMVRECDLLVVTAQRLYEKWRPCDRPMALARNGVDYDFYADRYRPNNLLAEAKRPVIGYYGAIAEWFDVELVAYAARKRPDYTFVLLGGVFNVDVSELKELPNVQLLGQQPYELMPQYLYHFDVCMIPFKVNPITEATDPVKLYEYLSAGKPVVCVALSEILPFGEYLYIAKDKDEFVAKLDSSAAEDDREIADRRRRFAQQNTWKQRYEIIETSITQTTPRASIIVVTYNNLALNKLCLESIIRNTSYPNYEIIVVDNNSTDATQAYLRYMASRHANISLMLNPTNNGFARANNQGIARSEGDYLVLLNNDTIVPPGWLSRLLRHLQRPSIGMVGPMTNFVGNEAKIDVPYKTWGEMEMFACEHTWAHDGDVADIAMLAMFCVALRRETYEIIGPLDEQFGVGMFEDDDYTQRLKAKGYRVVCAADVFVHHFGQAAFKKLIERGEYDAIFDDNRRRYETKWNVKWIPHKHAPLKFERLASDSKFLEKSND